MVFTQTHYITIANIINNSKDKEEIMNRLANHFITDNPKFKLNLFLKACGVSE